MRAKVMAAALGLMLTVGGVALLGYGVSRLSGAPAYSRCIGDGCLDDPWFLAFPAGIIGMVFGLIVAGWAMGSIRDERGSGGPLRAFGFMSGLGAVFVSLGAIFLAASSLPRGGTNATFVFLGGLFGIMGLAFIGIDLVRFRSELKTNRLRVSGLKGTARVVRVSDTNITVNNSPMVNLDLEVSVPGQPPFRTRRRTVISRLSVGALMPGATIAVLADPAKPRDIVLDWDAGESAAAAGDDAQPPAATALFSGSPAGATTIAAALGGYGVGASGGISAQPAGGTVPIAAIAWRELPAVSLPPAPAASSAADIPLPGAAPPSAGVQGRVSLDAIQDSGVDIGGNRLYTFDLTVSVTGRQPYQTKHAAVVPHAQIVRLQRGASFPAIVDPNQPARIAVQWDR